jgi:hypothetical protein
MSSSAHLDTSHHGPSHPFTDGGAIDRHPHCDGKVPLRCQQELHLGIPTGKNLEDSNLAWSVEALQCPPLPIHPSC